MYTGMWRLQTAFKEYDPAFSVFQSFLLVYIIELLNIHMLRWAVLADDNR